MTDQDKPRICEDLKVEVGERFNIVGCSEFDACEYDENQRFFIDSTGTMLEEMKPGRDNPASIVDGRVVCLVWNHPDRIIRKLRFTPEEMATARVLYAAGARSIEYPFGSGGDIWTYRGCPGEFFRTRWTLPSEIFPSIRPGQAVTLEDIINAE